MSTPATETPKPAGGGERLPKGAPSESRRAGATPLPVKSSTLQRGEPFIWFTGSALGLSLLMVIGLILLILVNGLGFFWPNRLARVTLHDGTVFLGEEAQREPIPKPGTDEHLKAHRIQLKVGNRDLLGYDFKWIDETEIKARDYPPDVLYVERREYGPLLGAPVRLFEGDKVVAEGSDAVYAKLPPLLEQAETDRDAIRVIEKDEIGGINYKIEQGRLDIRKLELSKPADLAERRAEIEKQVAEEEALYKKKQEELDALVARAAQHRVVFLTAGGAEKEMRTLDIFRAYPANRLGLFGNAQVYFGRIYEFLTADPRESNTEGGIFPAIFGTVMMVILMSLLAVPFGVLAALYLREYAHQGLLVRIVRIAVNNLAGVPSIVFGVFGLGFFVYFVGGSIDRLFFPEALPTPTFGTGGILWASLTLALLTVPVVIVASEEALAAVPRSMREASLAAGATKWQTIQRVVLPAAAPGILTGLILAMARAAGEVAPLMITGVVKLAPDLPIDGFFPFFHLERKFMHLGFHIYDVGFQSPNVEAAKPMVYTTTIFLLLIVVLLNLTAILVRNRLRRKYQTSAF
jgi:phosphate transport system permease protein